jgi:hypothetical protein
VRAGVAGVASSAAAVLLVIAAGSEVVVVAVVVVRTSVVVSVVSARVPLPVVVVCSVTVPLPAIDAVLSTASVFAVPLVPLTEVVSLVVVVSAAAVSFAGSGAVVVSFVASPSGVFGSTRFVCGVVGLVTFVALVAVVGGAGSLLCASAPKLTTRVINAVIPAVLMCLLLSMEPAFQKSNRFSARADQAASLLSSRARFAGCAATS